MGIHVTFCDNPAEVLSIATDFLASQPVLHNMILSLLHARVAHSEPGRYWIARQDEQIAGVIVQSPPILAANLTPMDSNVVAAMVDAIADAGVILPGVTGDAATAAKFAGQWTERFKSPAVPFQGMRLYEVVEVSEVTRIDGSLRRATADDRRLMVAWSRAFQKEIDEPGSDPELLVDRWLAAEQLWLWDRDQTMSMALSREPVAGVIRISNVYTPPEYRRRGVAEACVHGLSKWIRGAECRCILYADLGNPTSNSIYHRIGYRAVAEVLRYRFE